MFSQINKETFGFNLHLKIISFKGLFKVKIFDYEDIQLIPNKCIVESRSECDTTINLVRKIQATCSSCKYANSYE